MSETAMRTCEHGREIGRNRDIEGMAFAAPMGKCRCCQQHYPYIATGSMSSGADGLNGESFAPDTTLCDPCGGRARVTETVKGVTRIVDPGTTVES